MSMSNKSLLDRMFPHRFSLSMSYVTDGGGGDDGDLLGDDDPETVTVSIVDHLPCSVQHETTGFSVSGGGSVLNDHFVLLCPCFDYPADLPVSTTGAALSMVLYIRGREVEITGLSVQSVDTQQAFEVGEYKVGMKITFKCSTDLFL